MEANRKEIDRNPAIFLAGPGPVIRHDARSILVPSTSGVETVMISVSVLGTVTGDRNKVVAVIKCSRNRCNAIRNLLKTVEIRILV